MDKKNNDGLLKFISLFNTIDQLLQETSIEVRTLNFFSSVEHHFMFKKYDMRGTGGELLKDKKKVDMVLHFCIESHDSELPRGDELHISFNDDFFLYSTEDGWVIKSIIGPRDNYGWDTEHKEGKLFRTDDELTVELPKFIVECLYIYNTKVKAYVENKGNNTTTPTA